MDEKGSAVIMKNNMSKYLVLEFGKAEEEGFAADEVMLRCLQRLIKYQENLDAELKKGWYVTHEWKSWTSKIWKK